jgi:esterase/lipase
LIAHGDQDLAVPAAEAEEIYNWANKEKTELYIINNTGHTFGIVHPFEHSNEKFDKLLDKTLTFFNNNLK